MSQPISISTSISLAPSAGDKDTGKSPFLVEIERQERLERIREVWEREIDYIATITSTLQTTLPLPSYSATLSPDGKLDVNLVDGEWEWEGQGQGAPDLAEGQKDLEGFVEALPEIVFETSALPGSSEPFPTPQPNDTTTNPRTSGPTLLRGWPTPLTMQFHVRKKHRDEIGKILELAFREEAEASGKKNNKEDGNVEDDWSGAVARLTNEERTTSLIAFPTAENSVLPTTPTTTATTSNVTVPVDMITLANHHLFSTHLWRAHLLYLMVDRVNRLLQSYGPPQSLQPPSSDNTNAHLPLQTSTISEKADQVQRVTGSQGQVVGREDPTKRVLQELLVLFQRLRGVADAFLVRMQRTRDGDSDGRYGKMREELTRVILAEYREAGVEEGSGSERAEV